MTSNLALVRQKRQPSDSVSYIAPLKSTLTRSQLRTALRLLGPTCPTGYLNYYKPRRYGNNYGIPSWCAKCGRTAKQLGYEGPQRHSKRFIMLHLVTDH